MHTYGYQLLKSLPPHSLLISHTDLDWNPTRYLQECEAVRKEDVTHLNFQLMAFPWFIDRQADLYPQVRFPNTQFPGVSTNRVEEGNAVLIRSFLAANGAEQLGPVSVSEGGVPTAGPGPDTPPTRSLPYPGGIYIDMQAINDAELGAAGQWRGLTLIPWGTVYRVLGNMQTRDTEWLHKSSVEQFKALQKEWPEPSEAFFEQYPAGTWEYAAMSVYHDAQNQLGLNLLTYAIEMQSNADLNLLPLLLDRLHVSAKLLFNCHSSVSKHKALSSSIHDLHKNTAMAWMRLQGLVGVALQFRESMLKLVDSQPEFGENLIEPNIVNNLLTKQSYLAVLRHAKVVMRGFVDVNPHDKDVVAFKTGIKQIEEAESVLSSGKPAGSSGTATAPDAREKEKTSPQKKRRRKSSS